MKAIVFCGPTLRAADLDARDGFEFRPPARQGDVYHATRDKPAAIGLIDGFFDGQPAVLHKEILWAMKQGIAVFGAASMGALRAAELHAFGMRGVGRIFEAFRDGALTDDDEVALIHGPPETGYMKLSEPMVNIRATLDKAVAQQVIGKALADRLAADAKALFYQSRTWPNVLAAAGDLALSDTLGAWLKVEKVDQKREDGLELLQLVGEFIRAGRLPDPPAFHFEWTELWHDAPWRSELPQLAETTATQEQDAILDELRLDGTYSAVRRDALLRALVRQARPEEPDRQDLLQALARFREPRGLVRQADVAGWAAEHDTDVAGLEHLVADDARTEALAREMDGDLHRHMLDRLRELDRYGEYRERAVARRSNPVPLKRSLSRAALVEWYFEQRLGRSAPKDLAGYAQSLGIADADKFIDLLVSEYTSTTLDNRKETLASYTKDR